MCVCVSSKTLCCCGEAEDQLAREWVNFELDVENRVVDALHNVAEVTATSSAYYTHSLSLSLLHTPPHPVSLSPSLSLLAFHFYISDESFSLTLF